MGQEKKRSIYSNLFWRFAERGLADTVSFIITIILARIISPDNYGIVAIVTSVVAILNVFVDSGLGTALVQKKTVDEKDYSTVYVANIIFCLVLYVLLFVMARPLATFYKMEEFVWLLRVQGLILLISGVKNIQQAYIARNMLFRVFFFSTLTGTVFSGLLGLVIALFGGGVWALVAQTVSNVAIDTLVLWITVPWKPRFYFSFERFLGLFSYGYKLLLATLLDTIYSKMSQLVIGKVYSRNELAYYNRGDQFPNIIVKDINSSIDSVLLPALSQRQDIKEEVLRLTRKSVRTSMFLISPAMLGLLAVSEPLVSVILTEKWLPCVPYIRLFALSYMLWPVHTANLNAIKALGRSDIILQIEIFKKILGCIVLAVTVFISVKAVAIGLLLFGIACVFINAYPNRKLLNYSLIEQLKDILYFPLIAIVMAVVIFPIQFLKIDVAVVLLLQIAIGVLVYLLIIRQFKVSEYDEIINLLKRQQRSE